MDGSESKSPGASYELTGQAAPRAACEAARSFAGDAGLHILDADRLCILVEELVANQVEHGGAASTHLGLTLEGQNVRIELTDTGAPFDLRTRSSGSQIPERGGGAGLAIVQAWARVLSYRRAAGVNFVELLMPLRAAA